MQNGPFVPTRGWLVRTLIAESLFSSSHSIQTLFGMLGLFWAKSFLYGTMLPTTKSSPYLCVKLKKKSI